ncbi:hypothetical protein [Hanstruepera ponticola]|uniref:hypothetical protein n=1 Tax=Hanstruepera ponticola TaxID=2042995 RepID=UPI000CF1BA5E|nr:hypothetical protein [Hanstruepera ponticola]
MKQFSKFLIILVALGFWSCRDTKEVEETVETEIQQEESVNETDGKNPESDLQEASEELDKEVKELESALKELDTI